MTDNMSNDHKAQVDAAREECAGLIAGLSPYDRADALDAIDRLAALASAPPAPAASSDALDAGRLEWLLHRLSGKELRRIGVVTSSGGLLWGRIAIDAAIKGEQP